MKRVTIHSTAILTIALLLIGFSGFAQIQGQEYKWGKGITAGNTGSAYHVAMDKGDGSNVVQVGRFTDTLRAGGNTLYDGGMYITYSDTNGNVIWSRKEGFNYGPNIYGYSCPSPLDVEMLPDGSVVVLGTLCNDSINTFNGTPIANNGYFIIKYTTAGNFEWVKTYIVSTATVRTGTIEASYYPGTNNNIYVALTYVDTITLQTNSFVGQQSNLTNTALIALNLQGNEIWTTNLTSPQGSVIPKDILSIYNRQLYVLTDWGTMPFTTPYIHCFGVTDGLMENGFELGVNYGGAGLFEFEANAMDLVMLSSRIVIVGRFRGDVAMEFDTLRSATGGSELDIWIAEIDSNLATPPLQRFFWARSITSPGQDYAMDVIGFNDKVVLAGTLGIGGGIVAGNTLRGGSFLASYNEFGSEMWTLQQPSGFQAYIDDIKPNYNDYGNGIYIGGGIAFEALFNTDNIVNNGLAVNTVSQVSYLAKSVTASSCGGVVVITGMDTLISCQQPLSLIATYSIVGGNGNATVEWYPAQYVNSPATPFTQVVEHVHMQEFTITVTDTVTGCLFRDSVIAGVYLPHHDTLYLCPGDSVLLDMGPGATIYDWGNVGHPAPLTQTTYVDTAGSYYGVATYMTAPVNCGALTSLYTVLDSCVILSDSVWPGDANHDGLADLYDVLNIGIGYNIAGPARTNASVVWVGQAATNWNLAFLNGTNLKHADCDGDGHIDSLDVDVVSLNYGLTHAKGGGGSVRRAGSPPLTVTFSVDTTQAPAFVTADVSLGNDTLPVTNGYGIAFSLLFDNTLVDSSTIQTDFTGSWLGNGGSPQSLTKNLYSQGQLDIAHTRTTHASVSGFGHIATVSFYIQDNIIGKDFAAYNFGLDVTGSVLISDDETVIPLDEVGDTVLVLDEYTSIAETQLPQVSIYPNPGTGLFYIAVSTDAKVGLYNLMGQEVFEGAVVNQSGALLVDLSNQANGVYLVKIQSVNGIVVKRLVKQ